MATLAKHRDRAGRGRPSGRTVAHGLSTLVLLLLVLALGGAAWGVVTGQWRAHSVLSGSMEPRLPVGSVAITERVRTTSLEVGDVITFREPDDPSHLVTHRIVSITEKDGRLRYQTKGDANDSTDPWIVTLRGRDSYRVLADVPWAGFVVTAVRAPSVRPWLLLGAGVVLLVGVLNLFLPQRPPGGRRRNGVAPAAAGDEASDNKKEMAP
jgi:signal peptidase I